MAAEIRDAGGEAISVPGDVTADDFAAKIIKATIDKFGALHILVNNAGESHLNFWLQQQAAFGNCSTLQSALLSPHEVMHARCSYISFWLQTRLSTSAPVSAIISR